MNLFGCKFCELNKETGQKQCWRKNFDSLLWAIITVFQVFEKAFRTAPIVARFLNVARINVHRCLLFRTHFPMGYNSLVRICLFYVVCDGSFLHETNLWDFEVLFKSNQNKIIYWTDNQNKYTATSLQER